MADAVTDHVANFFRETAAIAVALDYDAIERMADELAALRKRRGRLFLLGLGGSAANCSHAANDFRKLCDIEAYAPTDNVAELTARANDDGWENVFVGWLQSSHLSKNDAVMVFSVGGGHISRRVSIPIVMALDQARGVKATVLGLVGRDGGLTKLLANCTVLIPHQDPKLLTPHTEAFQALVWHCLVSHPKLALFPGKWETLMGTDT